MAAFGVSLGAFNTDRSGSGLPAYNAPLVTTAGSGTNCRIVVRVACWITTAAGSLPTGVSDSGGAYTKDKEVINTNGQDSWQEWSRPVTSTPLASGSTITVAFPARTGVNTLGGVLIDANTITGVDLTNGGGVHATGSLNNGSGTGWSVAGAYTVAGIAVGGVGTEVASASTSTATSGTEISGSDQRNTAAQQGAVAGYLVVAGSGTATLSGTLSTTSTATTGGIVVYTDAGGGGAATQQTLSLTGVGS